MNISNSWEYYCMIDYNLFKEIELYANRHVDSSRELYLSRNQNPDKLFINILRGKVAEFCCYYSMIKAGYILENEPDLKIYSSTGKSYDADLVCIGKNGMIYDEKRHIHVKSVSVETYNYCGLSFLMQKNDPLVTNPLPNHYFSVLYQKSLTHYIFGKWLNSVDAVYIEPKNKHLSKTKVSVELGYLDNV